MEETKNLLVGFDLCDDYSQISSFHSNMPEPESVCISPDKSKYLIPTAVCIKQLTGEWLIGEEAIRCRDREAGTYITNLLSLYEQDATITVYGTEYSGAFLLEKFFRKTLSLLRQRFLNNSILQMVLTMKTANEEMETKLYELLDHLGLQKDRVFIMNHTMSFMYYTVSQKKELWGNDVALFDFDKEGLIFYQLTFGRRKQPYAVIAEQIDLSKEISYGMLSEKPIERLKFSFENLANETLYKKIISSLFVTGRGFEGDWSDDVLRSLCMGRRVFKGQNLYTKGACYAAKAIAQGMEEEFVFLPEDKCINTIALQVYQDTQTQKLTLAKIGESWEKINAKCVVILDDCMNLEFLVTDAIKRESIREILTLDGLRLRNDKTTRLEITLSFMERKVAVIKIKDIGFGEFYPTNYRIWEQIIRL